MHELKQYDVHVDVYDPWVDPKEAQHEYGITPVETPKAGEYDGVIVAVAHKQFKELGVDGVRQWGKPEHVLYDLKYVFDREQSDLRL